MVLRFTVVDVTAPEIYLADSGAFGRERRAGYYPFGPFTCSVGILKGGDDAARREGLWTVLTVLPLIK